MMYAAAIVAAGFAAGVLGQNATAITNGTALYTTVVETAFTTYCPEATVLTFGTYSYTVTEETTLTITDCPCTIVKPIVTPVAVQYTSCPPVVAATVVYPAVETTAAPKVVATYSSPLVIVSVTQQAGAAIGTGSPVQPSTALFTGAAGQNRAGEVVLGLAAAVAALVL